jgi:hypothetical protein
MITSVMFPKSQSSFSDKCMNPATVPKFEYRELFWLITIMWFRRKVNLRSSKRGCRIKKLSRYRGKNFLIMKTRNSNFINKSEEAEFHNSSFFESRKMLFAQSYKTMKHVISVVCIFYHFVPNLSVLINKSIRKHIKMILRKVYLQIRSSMTINTRIREASCTIFPCRCYFLFFFMFHSFLAAHYRWRGLIYRPDHEFYPLQSLLPLWNSQVELIQSISFTNFCIYGDLSRCSRNSSVFVLWRCDTLNQRQFHYLRYYDFYVCVLYANTLRTCPVHT